MWLGPAPKRPFNKNRFGVDPHAWSTFRYFWDYAGGTLTDIGVHWIDVLHLALNELRPSVVTAIGGRFWIEDNTETPDTLLVSFEYPQLIATWEQVSNNAFLMAEYGGGILFHGTKGTLLVTRGGYRIIPERRSDLQAVQVSATASDGSGGDFWLAHMTNFVACIKSRAKPNSDIETGYRSTAACLLGNVALRNKTRLDWDGQTLRQPEARKALVREYRKPWDLVV
jgi:predicted dehydrogenase